MSGWTGWSRRPTRWAAQVEMPPAFIVPGDSLGGATLEVARTVVRRAERLVARLTHDGEVRDDTPLKYLNRLSSLLFVLARRRGQGRGRGAVHAGGGRMKRIDVVRDVPAHRRLSVTRRSARIGSRVMTESSPCYSVHTCRSPAA